MLGDIDPRSWEVKETSIVSFWLRSLPRIIAKQARQAKHETLRSVLIKAERIAAKVSQRQQNTMRGYPEQNVYAFCPLRETVTAGKKGTVAVLLLGNSSQPPV